MTSGICRIAYDVDGEEKGYLHVTDSSEDPNLVSYTNAVLTTEHTPNGERAA